MHSGVKMAKKITYIEQEPAFLLKMKAQAGIKEPDINSKFTQVTFSFYIFVYSWFYYNYIPSIK